MTVTIFGSSLPPPDSPEYLVARQIGRSFAASGFTVCNGGYGGTMEASARGAKEAGGRTIGVTLASVSSRQVNPWIDKNIAEERLVDRLMKLIELGDAYVVLKGGTGTLLELAAVWEFMNKRLMPPKPCVVLGDFWHPAIRVMQEELEREGAPEAAQMVAEAETAEQCVELLSKRLKAS